MNLQSRQSLEICNDTGQGLRLEFQRTADRWRHSIFLLCPPHSPQIICESIEGSSTDRWPPSPPLQELLLQPGARDGSNHNSLELPTTGIESPNKPRTEHDVAFGLGRAGGTHWSASFELRWPPMIVVDVACRINAPAEKIGSAYRLMPFDQQWRFDPAVASMPCGGDLSIWLVPEPVGESLLVVDDRGISFRPRSAEHPTTLRWRYRIELGRKK